MLKDGLEESGKNCYIGIGPITGGPESVSQDGKSELLAILKVGGGSRDATVSESMGETKCSIQKRVGVRRQKSGCTDSVSICGMLK